MHIYKDRKGEATDLPTPLPALRIQSDTKQDPAMVECLMPVSRDCILEQGKCMMVHSQNRQLVCGMDFVLFTPVVGCIRQPDITARQGSVSLGSCRQITDGCGDGAVR